MPRMSKKSGRYRKISILNIMKKWCNGFRFHKDAQTVYNLVSLGMFFNENGMFINYCFSTGSPTFIFKVLNKQKFDFFKTFKDYIPDFVLDSFDVTNMQAAPLLLQTGYLTIESSKSMFDRTLYKLNFSNLEIQTVLEHHLVAMLTERNQKDVSTEIVKLQMALLANDTATMQQVLKSHIAPSHTPTAATWRKTTIKLSILFSACLVPKFTMKFT